MRVRVLDFVQKRAFCAKLRSIFPYVVFKCKQDKERADFPKGDLLIANEQGKTQAATPYCEAFQNDRQKSTECWNRVLVKKAPLYYCIKALCSAVPLYFKKLPKTVKKFFLLRPITGAAAGD